MTMMKRQGLSSFSLHISAMAFMLCDHLYLTLMPNLLLLRCIGRLAFPLFAFMAVEGCFHTRCFKKYLLRLALLALISEVPFDLLVGGTVFYPDRQNVIWTIILGLCCIWALERLKSAEGKAAVLCCAVLAASFAAAYIARVDYSGAGVLTLLAFYLFCGSSAKCRVLQLLSLGFINLVLLNGMSFAFPQQGLAVLSLVFVWLYDGRQGLHGKPIQIAYYLFYPTHMLMLAILAM